MKNRAIHIEHKIIKREKEFIDHDTIGYLATCSCGEEFPGWGEIECETKAIDHIKSYGSDRATPKCRQQKQPVTAGKDRFFKLRAESNTST